MRGQLGIGRVGGTEIRLQSSWFFIAALITFSLGTHLYVVNPDWPAPLIWTAALITALAFFAALLAHELSHTFVARARGIGVPAITLFALGGLAHLEEDAADAHTEFWMGLAGPVTSAVIGGLALGVAALLGWRYQVTPETPGMVMLVWFGWINLVLAAFNMIPGFPLDGGRVLRAIIWWINGNRDRATRIAAGIGQFVAFVFIAFGIFSFFSGAGFSGLWLAFIGFFLSEAARAAAADVTITQALRGLSVGDVMARDCALIDRGTPLSDVAHELLRTGRRCFFVMDDGRVAGMVTPQEIRTVERERWPSTPAGQAMRPLAELRRIAADAPLIEALKIIGREDVNQLPVVENGRLEGVVSRDQIMRLLSARAELTNM